MRAAVVIASDVISDDSDIAPLARAITQLLKPSGLLILADPAEEDAGTHSPVPVRGRAVEFIQALAREGKAVDRPMTLIGAECATVLLADDEVNRRFPLMPCPCKTVCLP